MKWAAACIRQRKKWIFMGIAVFVMMWLFMGAYSIPRKDILYSAVLFLFFMGVTVALETGQMWKRHRELIWLSKAVVNSATFPKTEDVIEKDYQFLLQSLKGYYEDIADRTRQSGRDMEDYYSMWVHQIKTPIAAMRLLLQTEKPDVRELEEELFSIEQYVDMVLQYIRLEAPANDFVIKRQPLDGIVREAVRKYARQFIRRKIRLEYGGTDCNVTTDKKWLSFCLGQFLSNAVKYTAKGSVTIRVKTEAGQESAETAGQKTYLEIIDTGIGIAKEDIPRVCEKGYTGCNGHNKEHSSGIGLFLSKQMLTKMGHGLELASQPGRGTTVRIVFFEGAYEGKD